MLAGISQLDNAPVAKNVKGFDENENVKPNTNPLNVDLDTHSNNSSPGTCYSTDPEKFCQNCKSEISDETDVQLPCPVYYYKFVNECPSPWLHYGYCTPCLEVVRFTNSTDIIDHITHCEALIEESWDGEHESHIEHYKRTESAYK